MTELVLPRYGSGSLADLLPSLAAHLGGTGTDRLGIAPADRYVVLLVDGLGWDLLRTHRREARYLGGLTETNREITAGVPSTTVTSLTSLGTGLPPGGHGMAGYLCRVPETGEVLNALVWDSAVAPRDFQPRPTVFEELRATASVSSVAPARFRGSGLTYAALRGPHFWPMTDERDEDARIEATVQASAQGERSLVYVYERELDHTGHVQGCRSEAWLRHLIRIDAFAARLRAALPAEVRLVVTGDHGMVDVDWADQLIVEDEPELMRSVVALAGEGRLRQLHTESDRVQEVATRWRERMTGLAWVRTRDEAIAEGWFGPVEDRVRRRFGDVLIAMSEPGAVMTRSLDRELSLVGMHGSLTSAEMLVPLLVD